MLLPRAILQIFEITSVGISTILINSLNLILTANSTAPILLIPQSADVRSVLSARTTFKCQGRGWEISISSVLTRIRPKSDRQTDADGHDDDIHAVEGGGLSRWVTQMNTNRFPTQQLYSGPASQFYPVMTVDARYSSLNGRGKSIRRPQDSRPRPFFLADWRMLHVAVTFDRRSVYISVLRDRPKGGPKVARIFPCLANDEEMRSVCEFQW